VLCLRNDAYNLELSLREGQVVRWLPELRFSKIVQCRTGMMR
jgi:hypothetical protein